MDLVHGLLECTTHVLSQMDHPEIYGKHKFYDARTRTKRFNDHRQVVRKAVNANPGLKVNRSKFFSCIQMFFTAYVLCILRLFKLKTEGQTI